MESIIQTEKECFICGRTEPLHNHHCIEGSYRKASDRYGLCVWLCVEHHMMAHDNETMMQYLRQTAQRKAMEHYGWSVDDFREHIGRSFL